MPVRGPTDVRDTVGEWEDGPLVRLLDIGSLVGALSIVEWFVWAMLFVLFGKRALVVAMRILRWLTVTLAAAVAALFVLITAASVIAIH